MKNVYIRSIIESIYWFSGIIIMENHQRRQQGTKASEILATFAPNETSKKNTKGRKRKIEVMNVLVFFLSFLISEMHDMQRIL